MSYDVITPAAARAVFESILWKPALRWRISRIEVLRPIRWISLRRNEVGAVIGTGGIKSAMNKGSGALGIYIEEERQQRAGLLLRDVAYRLHAALEILPNAGANNPPAKFWDMFERRAAKGQCINQPYLGCREFACDFRLVADTDRQPAPIDENRDLGWMLHDLDFTEPAAPRPRFFRAALAAGVLTVPEAGSPEVRG